MDAPCVAAPALGIANDPASGVSRRDRSRAGQAFAGLQRDVGDLTGNGIDLIERALREGIDLHGIDEAITHRLHARGGVILMKAEHEKALLDRIKASDASADNARYSVPKSPQNNCFAVSRTVVTDPSSGDMRTILAASENSNAAWSRDCAAE